MIFTRSRVTISRHKCSNTEKDQTSTPSPRHIKEPIWLIHYISNQLLLDHRVPSVLTTERDATIVNRSPGTNNIHIAIHSQLLVQYIGPHLGSVYDGFITKIDQYYSQVTTTGLDLYTKFLGLIPPGQNKYLDEYKSSSSRHLLAL